MYLIRANKNQQTLSWGEWLVFLGLLIYFVFFFFHASISLVYPNDLDNEEGFILNQIHQLRTGHTMYPLLTDYPYTVGNYPPVFQMICVPISEILGDHHFIGRLLSLVSTLAIGVLLFWFVFFLTGDRFSSIMAGLFPYAFHHVYRWAPYDRVDMLALFFTLLGLFFLLRSPKNYWLPVLCFVLGIFTKPVMVAAPTAAFIYLWSQNKKTAIQYAITLVLSLLLLFGFFSLITQDQFYKHIVTYNSNPFYWGDVWNYFYNFIRFYWIFLIIAILSFFLNLRDKESKLFSFYFIFAFLVSLSCGKQGSAVNYLIEFILAGSVLVGLGIHTIRKGIYSGNIIISTLLILQIAWIPHVPYTRYWYGTTPRVRDFDIAHSVERIVDQTEGFIVSDDASLLIHTKKPVLFQPFIMSTLARQGKWNPGKFINDIQQKKFSMAIFYFPLENDKSVDYERYTPEMIDAFRQNYELFENRSPYWIYKPKP